MGRIIERIRRRQRKGIKYSVETRNALLDAFINRAMPDGTRPLFPPEQVYYKLPDMRTSQVLWRALKSLFKNPLRKS